MKKWLYGIISLIMLGSEIAVAIPNDFSMPCEDGNVEVTAPKQETPNQDNSNSSNENNDNSNDDNSGDNSSDEPSQEPEESEEITEYVFKSYKDYFIDNDVNPQTITVEDVSGTGTEKDPIIIHSAKGLWYMNEYMVLDHDHIQLACDIELNDETFDENGNAFGGDGVVYEWKPCVGGHMGFFDGKGHSIKGMYINETTKTYVGLFGAVTLKEIKNLIVEDYYICGQRIVATVAAYGNIAYMANITTKNGFVIASNVGSGGASGVTHGVIKMENCKNYSKVIAIGANAYGIVRIPANNGEIINCENYGDILANEYAGGIAGQGDGPVIFTSCKNYGTVYVKQAYAGGIISHILTTDRVIQLNNCANYGSVIGNSWSCGGVIGYCYGKLVVNNCVVDAKINSNTSAGACAGIVGQIGNGGQVFANNCIINLNDGSNVPFIAGRINTKNGVESKMEANNCKITSTNTRLIFQTLCYQVQENSYVRMSNIEVDIEFAERNEGFVLIYRAEGNITYHNVLYNVNKDIKPKNFNAYMPGYTFVREGVLVKCGLNPVYYAGTDFSDYYVIRKTGEIGIKALHSDGTFNGKIDVDWLKEKGASEIA